MPGAAPPGPLGLGQNRPVVDRGTRSVASMPAAAPGHASTDQRAFEWQWSILQGEIANAGAHGAIDGAARARYDRLARQYRDEVLARVRAGRLSWADAAREASEIRNQVMTLIRGRSTPVGRALAQSMKREGKTLNELIARKARQLYGDGADWNRLSAEQRNRVFAAIVESSGKSNVQVTTAMRRVSLAGRALIVFSLAISVYNIATADDKADAAGREAAVTGGGIAGGIAAGALAGLMCGPGAPVCVTIGAFAGGAAGAMGADWLWSRK